MEEFVYKLPGQSRGMKPGAHQSQTRGSGMTFAAHAKLFDQPDPRRLDLRASLTSIHDEWLVKTYQQRSAVPVKVLVDISASMHFGTPGKLSVVADFLHALGNSTQTYGDSVSFMAFDDKRRDDAFLPATSGRGIGTVLRDHLLALAQQPAGKGSPDGLIQTVRDIEATSGLVFLVSDFHMPLEAVNSALDKLATALVVPIVVWDPAETTPPAEGQLLALRDSESGFSKRLWINRKTSKQWTSAVAQRKQAIHQHFATHGMIPIFLNSPFNAEQVSRYFMESIA